MFPYVPVALTERFSLSLEGLYQAVAARIAGNALSGALILLICGRLRRIETRVLWLIAAIREGRLRGGWVCPGRAAVVRTERVRPPVSLLPRGFAWLVVLVPYKAAGFGSQLAHLFTDPEMVALLAASPQLRKALRPLCRMLGIDRTLIAPVVPLPVAPVEAVEAVDMVAPVEPVFPVELDGVVAALGLTLAEPPAGDRFFDPA